MEVLILSFECVFIDLFYATVPIYLNAFPCSAASQKNCNEDIWVKFLPNLVHAILQQQKIHCSCFTMKLRDIRKHETGCRFWCEISRKSYKYFHLLHRSHHEQYAILLSAHRRTHPSSNSYHSFFHWKHIQESKWMGILSHIFPLFLNIRKNLQELHLKFDLSLYYWKKSQRSFEGIHFWYNWSLFFGNFMYFEFKSLM